MFYCKWIGISTSLRRFSGAPKCKTSSNPYTVLCRAREAATTQYFCGVFPTNISQAVKQLQLFKLFVSSYQILALNVAISRPHECTLKTQGNLYYMLYCQICLNCIHFWCTRPKVTLAARLRNLDYNGRTLLGRGVCLTHTRKWLLLNI